MNFVKLLELVLLFILYSTTVCAQKKVQPELMLPIGHTDRIFLAEYSPDGRRVVTASNDGTALIWDAQSGDLLHRLEGQINGNFNSAKFSPDGRLVVITYEVHVCANCEQTSLEARIWDMKSGTLLRTLKNLFCDIVFSPDGRSMLSASGDTSLIWDTRNWEIRHLFLGLIEGVFSPDSRYLVTFTYNDTSQIWDALNQDISEKYRDTYASIFLLWDTQNWEILHRFRGYNKLIDGLFSPDGRYLVTKYDEVLIWDVQKGEITFKTTHDHNSFSFQQFSPDARNFVTTAENIAMIWDAQNGGLLHRLEGHDDNIDGAQFSPDGKRLLTTSAESALIWDIKSGDTLHELHGQHWYLTHAEFSPDGKYVIAADQEKHVLVWEAESGTMLHDFYAAKDAVFSPDSKHILTESSYFSPSIRDVRSGELLHRLDGHTKKVTYAAFSPDGRRIVSKSIGNAPQLWDTQSGALLYKLAVDTVWYNQIAVQPSYDHFSPRLSESVEFSPDGSRIMMSSNYDGYLLWDAQSDALLHRFEWLGEYYNFFTFSPDGNRVVTAYGESIARIWDAQSGVLLHSLDGHTGEVRTAAFSPDGLRVVTTSEDSIARIWDAQSGVLLHSLDGHTAEVITASFSPDGLRVVTVTEEEYGSTRIWDAKNGDILFRLEDAYLVTSASFSPDGNRVVTGSLGDSQIWDSNRGVLLNNLDDHTSAIHTAVFSPDSRRLVTSSYDNTTKIWDVETGELLINFEGETNNPGSISFITNRLVTCENSLLRLYNLESGKLLYSFVAIDSTDYLVIHPDGYYDGTQGARDLLYFVCNDEVVDLAQLKDALYVPGLVEKIMAGQPINYKKLSELDICDALPLVDSLQEKPYHFMITQRKMDLERVEVYVNDKRVFNLPAAGLRRVGEAFELALDEEVLSLHLVPDTANKITVQGIVRTDAGSELRSRGIIVSTPGKGQRATPRLFAVMIGVSDYKDPALKLQYPVKDALDMSRALEAAAVKLLGRENVFMYLVHSDVTPGNGYNTPEKEGIRMALEDIGQMARPEDVVFIFFAGHGTIQDTEEKLFTFVTAEASPLNPNTGINTRELQDWLSFEGPHKMRANKTILIIDACNSGQATKELVTMLARTDDETRRIRQVEDLKDKSGMFILAASAPGQSAYEGLGYNQGLLTYSLLSVLKNNPDVLDDGKFLNVQKWFLESEKMQKKLVESLGIKQNAQPFGTANISIGVVDEEVKGSIVLEKNKPMLMCANVLNKDINYDNLQLKKLINQELSGMSEESDGFYYVTTETDKANKINVTYRINDDQVVCDLILVKEENMLHSSTVTGSKQSLDVLAKRVVEVVVSYVR